jgi:predicted acylesterase/phospholipase RssA
MNPSERKTAVVLSGGGANGAFEVGVMKALFNGKSPATGGKPIDPGIYSGSSVGAYNGAYMISRTEAGSISAIAALENTWVNRIADNAYQCGNGIFRFRGDPFEYLHPECLINHPLEPFINGLRDTLFLTARGLAGAVQFATSQEALLQRILDLFSLTAFISVEPLVETLKGAIDLSAIRQSNKSGKYVSTNWNKGISRIFENAEMTDELGDKILRASAAIPGFFPPVVINNEYFVDGGVLLTTPLSPAIEAGADIIHIIFLDPNPATIPVERLQSTLDVLDRFYVILTASQFRADIDTCRDINRGLDSIDKTLAGEVPSDEELEAFFRITEQLNEHVTKTRRYKKLEVHVYAPTTDLEGVLGLLNFERDRIENLIELGFKQAVEHDCEASGCILPSPALTDS